MSNNMKTNYQMIAKKYVRWYDYLAVIAANTKEVI